MFAIDVMKRKVKAYIDRQVDLKFIDSSKKPGIWEDAITVSRQDYSYDNLGIVSQHTSGESFIAAGGKSAYFRCCGKTDLHQAGVDCQFLMMGKRR
jgi:hypothetical protein